MLGFSFVFSGTVSAVFENAVFIFGVHAYDVGDVLYIDGQQLTVDEINMVGVDLDLDGQAPARRTPHAARSSLTRAPCSVRSPEFHRVPVRVGSTRLLPQPSDAQGAVRQPVQIAE